MTVCNNTFDEQLEGQCSLFASFNSLLIYDVLNVVRDWNVKNF
jgi:hypothetical protein